jgi:hypothetical protein
VRARARWQSEQSTHRNSSSKMQLSQAQGKAKSRTAAAARQRVKCVIGGRFKPRRRRQKRSALCFSHIAATCPLAAHPLLPLSVLLPQQRAMVVQGCLQHLLQACGRQLAFDGGDEPGPAAHTHRHTQAHKGAHMKQSHTLTQSHLHLQMRQHQFPPPLS